MIWILFYTVYLILSFTYKEYNINSHIEYISDLNKNIKEKIDEAEKIIKYKSSLAYKNKILKEQQSFKNKWEKVIYLTTEKIYNKFTLEEVPKIEDQIDKVVEDNTLKDFSIFEKWLNLLYKKNN